MLQKRNADARQCSQYVSEQMRERVLYLHTTRYKQARGQKCKVNRWPRKQGQQVCRLCWQIVLLQSQCSEVSNIQCTARLWSAHEDSFSSHYWGNHYFSITKWINKRTKQKCCFNFFEAVTAQHSLLSLCLHMNLEKLIASPDGCQKVKWKDSKNQRQYQQDSQRG